MRSRTDEHHDHKRPSTDRAGGGYLVNRGFPDRAIREVGWRVEPFGQRRGYGLPPDAADALVWVIPYPHRNGKIAFERIRLSTMRTSSGSAAVSTVSQPDAGSRSMTPSARSKGRWMRRC